MISLINVSKNYGTKNVLRNINFSFNTGKVYGVIGENGAGKTTLFNCIAGLESFSGTINCDEFILKNNVGLLQTEPYFFKNITGREYLLLLCNARQIKCDNIDEKNIFNLPLTQYASTYSSGMKKKLALTALLLQKNQVFILDEPFNGVDIQSNLLITQIILKLKALNKIVIMASHIFSTLKETCDVIHLLKNNQVVESVGMDGFAAMERKMIDITIGNKIELLNLE